MGESIRFGSAKPMPVTGSCCGIRPSKEALETDFEVDFSQAKNLLEVSANTPPKNSAQANAEVDPHEDEKAQL